jgi:glycosyltransferase involved in cell wall biosynthesis
LTELAVVIPVYNGGRFLDQTLASLAAQSRPPDVVVVSDDGSTDDSVAKARAWQSRLSIEVLTGYANAGAGTARKRAIACTAAPLIALVDADDVLLPDHLLLLERLHEERGGLVTSNSLLWVPGEALGSNDVASYRPVPKANQVEALLTQNFVSVESLFARSDYDKAGGFRSTEPVEDWDLWLRMAQCGVRISGVCQPTVLFRLRADSLTGFNDGVLRGEIRLLTSILEELTDPTLKRIAARSLRHRQSREALRQAYAAAEAGQGWAARRAALGALRGSSATRMRAAAMAAAPVWAARRRSVMRGAERLVGGGRWAARPGSR